MTEKTMTTHKVGDFIVINGKGYTIDHDHEARVANMTSYYEEKAEMFCDLAVIAEEIRDKYAQELLEMANEADVISSIVRHCLTGK